MRIVEPQDKKPKPNRRRSLKLTRLLLPIITIGILSVGFVYYQSTQPKEEKQADTSASVQQQDASQAKISQIEEVIAVSAPGSLRIFTDNEFNAFYNNLLQPNLKRVENPPSITGDDIADTRIRTIAEDRGYRLRASPADESLLEPVDGYMLQGIVGDSWENLQLDAANAGHVISIVSGYRSVEDQRRLFLQRLGSAGASVQEVATGLVDDIVDTVLVESSIPGYSKHHTAYTIDILCAGFVFEDFKNSNCNDWLVANNYKVAKENGFIPSYPPLADAQGPDPEAWEYVFVGSGLLIH